ncbi:MAG: helix-turn-helix domain-containing protein [Candidatus Sericytochromatia bacterium]|nr:helix-turn-helix domain-containing protein [Candidatus Sericytochromatia bacterium]
MSLLQEGQSELRNTLIASVFKELGYIEQWGSGLQRIKEACSSHGLAAPLVEKHGDFVETVFYRPTDSAGLVPDHDGFMDDYGRLRTIMDDYPELSLDEAKVLEYLEHHARMGRQQVIELLQVGKSKAHQVLSSLTALGFIIKQGKGRSTFYGRSK